MQDLFHKPFPINHLIGRILSRIIGFVSQFSYVRPHSPPIDHLPLTIPNGPFPINHVLLPIFHQPSSHIPCLPHFPLAMPHRPSLMSNNYLGSISKNDNRSNSIQMHPAVGRDGSPSRPRIT